MRHFLFAAIAFVTSVISISAAATEGCEVTSPVKGVTAAPLYPVPDVASQPIRHVPVGDIVRYPDPDDAPMEAEGWVWVRHDSTQESIYQAGEFGWMKAGNIWLCG